MAKLFISGGCKNGKSTIAQELACKLRSLGSELYYLATMLPSDEEDEARIKRHREERAGMSFTTIEAGQDIVQAVSGLSGTLLLDSVTALLANEMFPENGKIQLSAYKKTANDILTLFKQFESLVIVSDYIYSDAVIYDGLTEEYRIGLAYIDREVAEHSDAVFEVLLGQVIIHKGEGYGKILEGH